MKYLTAISFLFLTVVSAYGQSKTTENLQKKYDGSLSLFFYQNTLRMLNQSENKEFDELIKGIEKMKFLMIDKEKSFKPADYTKLKSDYSSETFEEVMTTRYQGRSFDVFLKEKAGKTQAMVILVNDSTSLYVLDVVGSIALDQVTTLYKTLDESADVGKKIKNFAPRRNGSETFNFRRRRLDGCVSHFSRYRTTIRFPAASRNQNDCRRFGLRH